MMRSWVNRVVSATALSIVCTVASFQARGGDVLARFPVGLVLPVGGSPISAEQVEELTQTSPSGELVFETTTSHIYRDRAGRMRIEMTVETPNGESYHVTHLLDPVTSSSYILLMDSKIAFQTSGPETGTFHVGFPAIGQPLPDRIWRTTTESLGPRTIQGIEAEGTRTTHTAEGEPPLTAVEESWSSRRLGVTLVIQSSGPTWKHVARLHAIDRHEPDHSLFIVPSDYASQ
jgi:hypothetical protein